MRITSKINRHLSALYTYRSCVLEPAMAEWLQLKFVRIGELNNVADKKGILSEIKVKLGNLSCSELQQISAGLELGSLFTQLTSTDRAYVEQVCEVSKSLFALLEHGEVYTNHHAEIQELITHSSEPMVRSMVLNEVLGAASNPEKISHLLANTALLVAVAHSLTDNDVTVANSAMSILKEIGKNTNGQRVLYTGELLRSLARLLGETDATSFRVYEIVVDVAKSSKEGLEASAQSGFLDSLISILEAEDILLQLNALEILTNLALTEEGLSYLERQEVLRKLVQKVAKANESPLSNLLIPGLMKFFGNVARHWPNAIFSKYPIVVSALFEVIESGDQTILGVALDTLGHVAASVEGKYALQALGDTMPCALEKIIEVIRNMPTALRIRGLNNLALILDVKKEEQDNRILSLTKSWFDSLCDDPLEMIVTLCKQPFADIRQAGLEVLAVVASQVWGREYVSIYPGLVEFLLDRGAETFKECKEAKYEVVKCLSQAEQDIFNAETMQRLEEYVDKGPHFVDVQTDIALDGGV